MRLLLFPHLLLLTYKYIGKVYVCRKGAFNRQKMQNSRIVGSKGKREYRSKLNTTFKNQNYNIYKLLPPTGSSWLLDLKTFVILRSICLKLAPQQYEDHDKKIILVRQGLWKLVFGVAFHFISRARGGRSFFQLATFWSRR